MSSFGEELRSRRQRAGLSLAELGRLAFYTKPYLSKVENGQKPPTVDLARRCDAALGAGGELAAMVSAGRRERGQRRAPSLDPARPAAERWARVAETAAGITGPGVPGVPGVPGALPVDAPVAGVFPVEGFSLGGLLAGGPPEVDDVGRGGWERAAAAAAADEGSLATLTVAFENCRLMGHQFSPRPVLAALRTYAGWVHALAEHAADPVLAERFGLLAARYAEYAGWMAQEAGDDAGAGAWTQLAVSWARAAGDAELPWLAHVRAADIALYRDDPNRMIAVSRLAQQSTSVRIRGIAAQREAQGYALLGDDNACRRALASAESLHARWRAAESTGEQPRWPITGGAASVADPVMITTGWSLFDLGHPARAAEILDREVPRISPVAIRARARYGLRRALAHAAAGNVDHAGTLLNALVADIARADSATIRVDLRRAVRELSRWRTHTVAADLLPLLTAVLRAG